MLEEMGEGVLPSKLVVDRLRQEAEKRDGKEGGKFYFFHIK
jgi:hypothetical protein